LPLLLCCLFSLSASATYGDSLPSLKSLREGHIKFNNTQYVHNKLNSFLAKGRVLRQENDKTEEQVFRIYKKRPDKYRSFHAVVIKNIVITTENIYDGKSAISIVSRNGQEISRNPILGDELSQLKLESLMDGPFIIVLNEGTLKVEALERVEGVDCVRLLVDGNSEHPYRNIWLRLDNFQEAKITQIQKEPNGQEQLVDIYFSEFDATQGTIFARRSDKKINGELVYTTIVDLFETNYGIYNSFFKVD